LEASPRTVSIREVEEALRRLPQVVDVHDLHIWRITPLEIVLSAHLVVESEALSGDVLQRAQQLLRERFGIHHAALQVEPPWLAQQWQCTRCRYSQSA
jgi:cobalt-zinc-cadmium efflux system protein